MHLPENKKGELSKEREYLTKDVENKTTLERGYQMRRDWPVELRKVGA